MIQMGPMARYIDDLILVLPVLSGPDWHDPACVPVPLRSPGDVDLSSLRIAVYTENGIAQPTTTTVETVLETATMLRRAGAEVNEEQPPGVDLTLQMGIKAIGRDWLEDALEHTGTQAEERHELLNEFLEILASQDLTALEYKLFLAEWNAFQSSMHRFMTKYDIVLCPVSGEAAMRHGTTWANYEQMSYPTAYNLSGLPAVSVRAGTSPEGLPINVQVVAGPWREDAALAVARHIETELGGWSPPALLNA
jgi:amidase